MVSAKPPATSMTLTPARARLGVSLMFFTNGVLFANLLPRYPEVKAGFGLTDVAFGVLVMTFPLGALLAAASSAPLMRRFGTRAVNAVGSVLLAAVLALAGGSPTVWLFGALLVLAGTIDAIVDSAQNVQGVIVEEWRGRSIMNSLHAIWSLGATVGGLIGTACAAAVIPLQTQLIVNGSVWALVALAATHLSATPHDTVRAAQQESPEADGDAAAGVRSTDRADARLSGPRPWRLLAPLVVLAICGTLQEEFANSWAALYVARETTAPATIAGLGFTIVLASQFVGRLLGDPMTDRWGRNAVARAGGLLIAVGVVAAMAPLPFPVTLLGFALIGLGSATLVPAAFAAAARVPGLPHGTGIAYLGWLMRLGFLVTSPLIGLISEAGGLRLALVVPLTAGLIAAAIAHRLATRS